MISRVELLDPRNMYIHNTAHLRPAFSLCHSIPSLLQVSELLLIHGIHSRVLCEHRNSSRFVIIYRNELKAYSVVMTTNGENGSYSVHICNILLLSFCPSIETKSYITPTFSTLYS